MVQRTCVLYVNPINSFRNVLILHFDEQAIKYLGNNFTNGDEFPRQSFIIIMLFKLRFILI